MKKLLWTATILSALLLSACGDDEAVKDNGTKVATNNENAESKEESKGNDFYFKDNEVKIEDLKIKITDTKVIQPGEKGNEYGEKPVIAFWYDTTNLSDKDIDPITAWIAVFTAIQDNNPNSINELEMGMLPDESHLDSQMETIKKDGTVSNSIAYELDDLETPVTLVATRGVLGDEIGKQDYNVK